MHVCRCFLTRPQIPQLLPALLRCHSLQTRRLRSARSAQIATLGRHSASHYNTCSSTTSMACFGPPNLSRLLGEAPKWLDRNGS